MPRRPKKKPALPNLNATAARHRELMISWHGGWGFNRRAHARLSHRHYLPPNTRIRRRNAPLRWRPPLSGGASSTRPKPLGDGR